MNDFQTPSELEADEATLRPSRIKLLKLQEFCEQYSLSRSAAYRQRKSGALRFTKIGNATRITIGDAEAWLAALRDQAENDND